MKIQPRQTILFMGDSVTDCGRARPVGEGFSGTLGSGYVADINSILISAQPTLHPRIINMGISGNTVRDLKARWQQDCLALSPDWVFLMIGINDVWRHFDTPYQAHYQVPLDEYRETLGDLVCQTLAQTPNMVLLTPYMMEPNKNDPMRAMMDSYGQAVKDIGAEKGICVLDTQAAFDGLFAHIHPMMVAGDRIHPNPIGHMLIARMILKHLGFEW